MLFISYANESSRLDENLPVGSQFYSDHHVNFSTYRYCQSATFGPLAFSYFIVLSIKLVFMVLGISYSRVLAQRPTGCCSASTYMFGRIDLLDWTKFAPPSLYKLYQPSLNFHIFHFDSVFKMHCLKTGVVRKRCS